MTTPASTSRAVNVKDHVIYHDEKGRSHQALVTAVHGPNTDGSIPCINLVFVSGDETRQDQYGRQIERLTSIVHKSNSSAHGFYFRFEDEEPNPRAETQS